MPERLDRVEVATRYRLIEISWAAREAILDKLRNLQSASGAVAAFEAVGASRPVELDRQGKVAVLQAIGVIAEETDGGHPNLDPPLFELRNNLVDELGLR